MDIIRIISPTVAQLPVDNEKIRDFLAYKDKSVAFQISRLKKQFKYTGAEWLTKRIDVLKQELEKSACWNDEDGNLLTYSGLAPEISKRFGWKIVNEVVYPDPKLIPWAKKPFGMRVYQSYAVDALLEARHAGIELPTGSGKSLIIINICKKLGIKTTIMTPSSSISNQLYKDFVKTFGQKYVGMYGDGKKKSDKLFTITNGQALTRLEEDSEHYENISQSQVFIADESHSVPSETFKSVCMGVCRNAPYRFFVSATQLRNDGSGIILKGITGPIVFRKGLMDLVKEGYLAEPVCKMFSVPAAFGPKSDAMAETRSNLYDNPKVNKLAADIANKCVLGCNRPTVILIEEFKQFANLYPYLKVPFVFASGTASKEAQEILSHIPREKWEMDTEKAIEDFNEGRYKLLIGTSAVSTGVDLRPTQALIYMQGGKSPIKLYQGIGRGTRLYPGKTDCWVIDFFVKGSPTLERHALERKTLCEELTGHVDFIEK